MNAFTLQLELHNAINGFLKINIEYEIIIIIILNEIIRCIWN